MISREEFMRKFDENLTKLQKEKVTAYVDRTGKWNNPKWTEDERDWGEKFAAKRVCKKFVKFTVLHPEFSVEECLDKILKEENFPKEVFLKYYVL